MFQRDLILAILGISLITAGCTKQSASAPGGQEAAQGGISWQLAFKSTCVDGATEDCVGHYGFSLDSKGNYQVGPGPENQVRTGIIGAAELNKLSDALNPFLKIGAEDAQETCNAGPGESADTLILTRQDNHKTIIRTGDAGFCFSSATADQAAALHRIIRELAGQHYLTPFPDACADASDRVEALYPSVQQCTTDTDCGYFTPAFEVVPPGTLQYIVTDDCSRIKPLVIGNIGAVIHSQRALIDSLETAQRACGQRMVRQDCSGVTGFQATDRAPRCVQKRCSLAD